MYVDIQGERIHICAISKLPLPACCESTLPFDCNSVTTAPARAGPSGDAAASLQASSGRSPSQCAGNCYCCCGCCNLCGCLTRERMLCGRTCRTAIGSGITADCCWGRSMIAAFVSCYLQLVRSTLSYCSCSCSCCYCFSAVG